MHLQRWVAFGTLLAAAFHAHAGQPSRAPDPADPSAAVPAITYRSALAGYTPAAKEAPAPAKAWRAANASVAGQPGQAEHHAPAPQARKEAAPPKSAPANPAHAHHQQH
jgi:hypothetical protein